MRVLHNFLEQPFEVYIVCSCSPPIFWSKLMTKAVYFMFPPIIVNILLHCLDLYFLGLPSTPNALLQKPFSLSDLKLLLCV